MNLRITTGVGAPIVLCMSLMFAVPASASHQKKATSAVTFAKIDPILKKNCVSCHNPERHPENVDLSSYAATMKSGGKTPLVVKGHPEKSGLLLYVNGERKPLMPMGKKPLSKAEISLLKSWVSGGAKQ